MAKKNKKNKGISLNLSEVSTGSKAVPEGRYQVRVVEAEVKESQAGNPFIAFTFEVVEGKNKKAKLFHNCSLQPQALFNLKSVLEALQYEIPDGEFDLELEEIIDLECIIEVEHETYEGKKKARIIEFDPVSDSDGDDDDEDEDDDSDDEEEDDEDEDEDEEDEEDLESMSLKELKAKAKELGIKIPKKADKDDIIELIEEALEDEEDEDDEEDDEDEIDYSELSLKELKALAKERGIKVKKGMDEDDIIELLEEDDEE